jgi:hypothetical protein
MTRVCSVQENMLIVIVELLVAGLIVVLAALLLHRAWVHRRRRELLGFITEAQARENAAPLATAILASDRRERARS